MSKVKIKTNNSSRANSSVSFGSSDLIITFDQNCEAEIESDMYEKIKENDSIEILGKGSKDAKKESIKESKGGEPLDKGESKEKEASEDKEESSEKEDDSEEEGEDLKEQLEEMTVAQLKEMAIEAELPQKDYEGLKKADLIQYLLEQLSE